LNQSNKLVVALIAICAAIWIVAAIQPLDRQAWVLERDMGVAFVGAVITALAVVLLNRASAERRAG
jgi:hypothetical protein